MWKEYREKETLGYVSMISEDYSKYLDNATVILLDTFSDGMRLLTKKTVKFTEYFGSDSEEGMNELKESFKEHYNKEPESLFDLAFYCADGWSRWGANERIENPSDDEIKEFMKSNNIK